MDMRLKAGWKSSKLDATKDLTVGMACYQDYWGVWPTVQSLRIHHNVTNIIVVDNSPNTEHGKLTKDLCVKIGANYIEMPGNTGTTQPRQKIFDVSKTKYTMCVDCHILIEPMAIELLMKYFKENPDTGDLLSGPMVYDPLVHWETQFNDEWRSEMHGIWGRDPRGDDINNPPFEIWGQGLGLFACRTKAWQGFNPHFRGFGGEEGYIHEKFRQAGHKALCLPFLRWVHRYGKPDGVKYPLTRWNKVRNYVLGHLELGWPLSKVHEHFVTGRLLSQKEWDYLIEDPVGHVDPPSFAVRNPRKAAQEQINNITLPELFQMVKGTKRDLDQHADVIREYAEAATSMVAFVKRQEWNVLLAEPLPRNLVPIGKQKKLVVYQTEDGQLLGLVHKALNDVQEKDKTRSQHHKSDFFYQTTVGPDADSLKVEPIGPVDLLVFDTVMTGDRIYNELNQHGKQAQRILVRGTGAFGLKSEFENSPGLLYGMDQWMKENEGWFLSDHYSHQYGFTVMSRIPEDRPAEEIRLIPPGKGPGTELKYLIGTMGIAERIGCDCNRKAQQMDLWGIEVCKEKRDTIVGWMHNGAKAWGWADKIKAAAKAVKSGLAFKLDPTDPYGSLIDEAIRRAEANELP